MASNFPIFQRLIGLETEYALRWHAEVDLPRPSHGRLYTLLAAEVGKRVLTVPAKHFKTGSFTANGGAIWFEAEVASADAGLVEGSSPECRGPFQMLLYQRAQDRLLAEAASSVQTHGQVRLIKNDRDSRGNVYGAQENYEALVGSGLELWLWRLGLVALLPLAAFTWLLGLLLLLIVLFAVLMIAAADLIAKGAGRSIAWSKLWPSRRADVAFQWLQKILIFPLALGVVCLSHVAAFRSLRRKLLPFLVSRAVFSGAGLLDEHGHFQLADKAPGINSTVGFVGFWNDRPIFTMGHFFKVLCLEAIFSPRAYFDLFGKRQRLQIGLGDSNMCDEAELLRVGVTLLVIDAIEAGAISHPPELRNPIEALHAICRDPSLSQQMEIKGKAPLAALQIQHFYRKACQEFLEQSPHAPAEAWDILRRWSHVLERLENDPYDLMGRIDWVTKKQLLEEAGEHASPAALKKIDLKYHELGEEGYHGLLMSAGVAPPLVDAAAVEKAMRTPPNDTPATTRSHYIREFSGVDSVSVNWKVVSIRQGQRSRIIRLSKFGKRSEENRLAE